MAVDRLKKRPDYVRAARKGRSIAMPGLVLQAVRRNDGPPRVGFTASKRVGNAVARNRARRRLRAAVDAALPCHGARGYDYVVIARAATVDRPFAGLTSDLETALKRLNVWRD